MIAKAYHRWGAGCVERFLGVFAFAVYEHDSRTTVLARDRLGIKPLYLAETPGRLRFASTLPALLAAGEVGTSIDPVALHHYLSFHSLVPAPRTILTGIRKLPPATVRTIHADGSGQERTYWSASHRRRAEHAAMSADGWSAAVLDALRRAVHRRMVADVPVGVLLSGGLDSSLVVALLAEQGQRGLRTFSVGFEAAGGESGDEFRWSDAVAGHFGTDHEKLMVPAGDLLPAVDRAVAASEPMVSHDCVAFYLLSEQVSRSVTVVQSGQGADEVFAGYDWYRPLAGVPRDRAEAAYRSVFVDRPHTDLAEILEPDRLLDHDASARFVAEHFAAAGQLGHAGRRPGELGGQHDHGLGPGGRVPFLDHELVELAAACPAGLKPADGGKGVLKRASRGVVPDTIVDRPKGYFPVPASGTCPAASWTGSATRSPTPPPRPGGCSGPTMWSGCWPSRTRTEPPWAPTRCGR